MLTRSIRVGTPSKANGPKCYIPLLPQWLTMGERLRNRCTAL